MSDDAAEKPKKKSKLPVIMIAVLVVAGGGYFMTSGKKKEVKKPPIMLGEAKMDLGEFTAQLTDAHTYLKLQVVIQLKKDAKVGGGEGEHASKGGDPVLRNAVQMVLAETSPSDISTADGIALLKEKIAWKLNAEMELQEKAEKLAKGEEPEEKKDSKKKKKGEPEPPVEPEKFHKVPMEEREHPEWQSEEGPVLMVFFPSFLPAKY